MYCKKTAVTALVLVVCFTSHAAAGQAVQVTCTGKVVDIQGRPVAGAKVTAYEMIFDGLAGNFNLHKAGEVISTEDGAFVFTTGQKPERSTFHECKIVAVKSDLALGWTAWKMREDAVSDIRLGSPEKLSGVIVDDAGKPVAGADVRANLYLIVKTTDGEEKKEWLPGIEPLQELGAKTDSRGRFLFGNLPTDARVDLLVMAPGKAITYTYQTEKIEPAFKAGQTDIKVALPAEARIEGQILDPDTGKGVAGTKFAVVDPSGLFYYRFVHTTNSDGTFKVGGLRTDKYLLRNGGFPPNTYVEAESGKITKIMVMADRLSRPGGIAGVVRDPEGRPLVGAVVSTYPPVTEQFITKAGGEFVLRSKRAPRQSENTIYLFVRHEQRNLAVAEVLDESAKEYDVTVIPAATLSGKVVDAEGKGIAGTKLSLIFWVANQGYDFSDVFEVDNAGGYEIKTISPGCTYSVEASAEGYGRRSVRTYTGGAENERVELEPMILSVANISASGIVVDEFDQPVSEVALSVSGDSQPSRRTLTDAKGRFTIENICSGRINIYADKGTPRRLSGHTEAEAGETDVRIVVAEIDERGRQVPRQPPSRVGKPLPELTNLKIELPPADIDGKMILVYFWDMQQRPSRNTLLRLAKRAEELKLKGVTIVAVQAVKVDENTLNEWVKKNGIPFPAGMARGDETKTRFTWGIRFLPWLILTDREHIVRAEGFGLDELDEKLSETGGIASVDSRAVATQGDSVSVKASEPSSRQIKVVGIARDRDGKPVAGAEVQRLHGPGPVITDAAGRFELLWDPERGRPLVDTYYIIARHERENLSVVLEVPEFEQGTESVNLNLLPGVTFKCKVVDPAGQAIELARVSILLHTPTQGSGLYNTITDSEGMFEFRGIPTDHKYSFAVQASGHGTKWVHDIYAGYDFARKDFKLEPMTLAIADQSVSGVVVDANDKPVSGALLSTDGEGQPQHYNVRTDADGKFTIDEVCTGDLRIYATVRSETLLGYARTHGGATDVRIVLKEVPSPDRRRFVPKTPPSLVGRALPEVKDLAIELSPAEAGGKQMLLCFFDLEQRPSRYFVSQLAKQAGQLKDKDLAVVVVQASKIDANRLNEWIKENNIPFQIGMARGDATKTRLTWGIKSLPWLILTDRQHIVRAEGFAFSELNDRIDEVQNSTR